MPPTTRRTPANGDNDAPATDAPGDPGEQITGDASRMSASPENPGQDGPVRAEPSEDELKTALDADVDPAVQDPAGDDDAERMFRVVPADWQIDAAEFPDGTEDEAGQAGRTVVNRLAPPVLSNDDANTLIAAAADAGVALTKEPVA